VTDFTLLSITDLGVGHFDDGLIYIGTRYCFNHHQPSCAACPIDALCEGYRGRPALIQQYRT